MPAYPWMLDREYKTDDIPNKINALRTVGVPYAEGYEDLAIKDAEAQAEMIAQGLKDNGFGVINDEEKGVTYNITSKKQIIALIAYLQRVGTDITGDNDPFAGLPSDARMGANIVED